MSEFVSLWLKFMDRHAYMCLTARTLAMTGKNALKFMDRHAYMCLTARTLAMTGKNAHRFMDRWPRQCQRHLHKGRCATYVARLAMTGKEASVLKQCSPQWPRHGQCAYMCLTARTLAMTDKETAKAKVF